MTSMSVFSFDNSVVRTNTDDSGVVWFCVRDIAEAIEHSNPTNLLRLVEESENKRISVPNSRGESRETPFVSKRGLYQILWRSDLPNYDFCSFLETTFGFAELPYQKAKDDELFFYVVYFDSGVCKLGYTSRLLVRMNTYVNNNCGSRVTTIYAAPTERAKEVEKYMKGIISNPLGVKVENAPVGKAGMIKSIASSVFGVQFSCIYKGGEYCSLD